MGLDTSESLYVLWVVIIIFFIFVFTLVNIYTKKITEKIKC